MAMAALNGVTVIELGEGISAPFCAKLLSDYGAEVIKIEKPLVGDITRHFGPYPDDKPDPEKSGAFFVLNTNKKSVTLDMEQAKDRELFLKLVEGCDLLVENNPPAKMKSLGLDYDSLLKINPRLIMVSITPFGQNGPYASWKGIDLNAFHLTAAGSRYCGRKGEPPLKHTTHSADYYGAYVAATWALASLFAQDRVGGEYIDVSCAEAIAASFVGAQNIGGYAQDGVFGMRTGVGMPLAAPATILPCQDGYVWMLALETGQWKGLVNAMGNPEWAQLDIFDNMFTRAQNADLIYAMMTEWTMAHTKQQIMDLCQENNCPSTAVYTVGDVATHPHLKARGQIVQLDHPVIGRVQTLGAPVRCGDAPAGPTTPAPLLGQHNAEILGRVIRKKTAPSGKSHLPLQGIRVANFGWGWLGPVAGQTLSRLGAEVFKIESWVRVDINRTIPPFAKGHEKDVNCSIQNHAGWAGNGSVTINLKTAEGQALARELVRHCDVVMENFGPGVMKKLNLDYEKLRAVKEDIILVSMPAAGLTGPLSNVRTYGMSLSSITGLDSVTGYKGGPPVPMENAFADPLGGIIGAFAAQVGLHYRKQNGKGLLIDMSQQEGVLQLMGPAFMDYAFNGRVLAPQGNDHPQQAFAPHGVFPCAGDDRWIALATTTEAEWQALVLAMGSPAWAQESRFATLDNRIAHIDALHEKIGEFTKLHNDIDLANQLQAAGIAATPVLNVADLLHNPHYQARRTFIEVEHPLGFRETVYGNYVKTRNAEAPIATGPVMGQDNERVFRQLMGIDAGRYQQLIHDKTIH